RPRSFSRRAGLALAVASALILITTAVALRRSSLEYSLIGSSHQQVLFVGDSAYHRIVVLQRLRTRRELMFDTAAQTRMDTRDPFGPGNPYTDSFHLARLMRPDIKRVLMIGLGGGTAAKQFVRYYPDVTFDVVEVDPMVVHVAQQFFGVQPGGRLRIHLGDGRTFVQRSAERWDLIIIDAYTEGRYGVTIPPHLATREFFNDVASHLTEGGILHFHCVFTNSPLLPAIEKTIANVFPSTLVAKGEIIGSMVPLITPREVMTQRASLGPTARLPELTSYIALLGPVPPIPARIPLLTDDYAPVDTLIHAPH
ncbi:MAG: fused MFS/spermidine synthase, partial [Acidobacteriota bacterium]